MPASPRGLQPASVGFSWFSGAGLAPLLFVPLPLVGRGCVSLTASHLFRGRACASPARVALHLGRCHVTLTMLYYFRGWARATPAGTVWLVGRCVVTLTAALFHSGAGLAPLRLCCFCCGCCYRCCCFWAVLWPLQVFASGQGWRLSVG